MGFLDRLAGNRRGQEQQAEEAAAAAPTEAPQASTTAAPGVPLPEASYGPPKLDMQQGMPSMPGLTLPDAAAPASRLYDPYEGISAAVTGKKHAFKLPNQPEFVFEEEAAVKRRGWNENLQFYTGIGYVSGGVSGGSIGLYQFVTQKPLVPTDSAKLKFNRFLNLCGQRAKPYSQSAAILGLYFSSLESFLSSQLDKADIPEPMFAVGAGTLTGALYRSPRGPRQALAAGVVGAAAGAGVATLRMFFPSL